MRGEGEGSVIGSGGGKEGRRGWRVVGAVSSPVVVVSKEGRKERLESCGGGVGRQGRKDGVGGIFLRILSSLHYDEGGRRKGSRVSLGT